MDDENVEARLSNELRAERPMNDPPEPPVVASDDENSRARVPSGCCDLGGRIACNTDEVSIDRVFGKESFRFSKEVTLSSELCVAHRLESRAHALRWNDVHHCDAAAATDESGCMEQRTTSRR